MTPAETSSSHQRRPCAAAVGKAWWLLCHDSPIEGRAAGEVARLVVGGEAPPAEEVTQRVDAVRDVVHEQQPHPAAPQQPGQAPTTLPLMATPRPKDAASPPIAQITKVRFDGGDDGVGDQVGRVARLVAALGVDEQPAHVRVREATQRAAPAAAVVDVRAVGVAVLVGERWCLRWSATQR